MALVDTPICDFGWKAPDFSLPDPSGTMSSKDGLMGPNGLLVAFLCNHCPYVKGITTRLAKDTHTLMTMGIGVVGIMSNDYRDYPDDAPKKMLEFAAEAGWNFPYLVDEDQSIGKAYGAVCTPDFFGFNADGELQYRGRLDDKGLQGGEGRTPELVIAMKQVVETGQGPENQIPSMGCSIKWS